MREVSWGRVVPCFLGGALLGLIWAPRLELRWHSFFGVRADSLPLGLAIILGIALLAAWIGHKTTPQVPRH